MTSHEIAKVKTRKTRAHTIYTVVCACGATFESIGSEAMARSYHKGHRLMEARA